MKIFLSISFLCLLLISCTANPEQHETSKQFIEVPGRPSSNLFSHAVEVNGHIFLSGQLGYNYETNELEEGIEGQTHQALKNIKEILKVRNYFLSDVVEVQVFVDDMDNYSRFNDVYTTYFPTNPPARAVVEVSRLPRDAKVEIKLSAIK